MENALTEAEFKNELQHALLLCSPEHGIFLSLKQLIPVQNMSFDSHFLFFSSQFSKGEVLKVVKNKKTVLIAFVVTH